MEMMQIWIQPDPLKKGSLLLAEVPIGQTIREVAGLATVEAWVNGLPVDAYYIENTIIPKDVMVIISPIPQGSTKVWRTIAIIAVVVVAAVAAPLLAPLLGLGTVGTAIASGLIGAGLLWGGMALVDLFLPMPDAEGQEGFNRLAALTGQQNRMGAYTPIPRLYGKMRYFPVIPMTGPPYTELLGGDQYMRMLLCLGHGPLSIGGKIVGPGKDMITQVTSLTGTPIKIGETDIMSYEGVEFQIGRHDQISLYTNEVMESNPNWKTDHPDPGSGTSWDNVSTIRTSDANAIELSIDVWGVLYSINEEGKTSEGRVYFKIEYRETETTGTWLVAKEEWILSSSKRETIRSGFRWSVPLGKYDIRLTRIKTYHQSYKGHGNEMTWVSLRTIRNTKAFQVDDTIVMALRIKATDQLQGSLNNVSIEATAVLPVWNGTTWVEQATRNPAWALVDVLTGKAGRRPISKTKLDTAALLTWANQTNSDGDYFDQVYDDSATVLDRINSIAATGRANWGLRDDARVTIIQDIPDPTPKMIISPRNSSSFSYELSNIDIPHAFRVKFIDGVTWENTERVVYDDGYDETNATLFQEMEAIGCTNSDQAWRLGRYHLAQRRLRPETYTFTQGIQYLHYSRGDLLQLQHEVIMVGLSSGRITSIGTTTTHLKIKTDIFLYMEAEKTYGIKVMKSNGTVVTSGIRNDFPGTEEPMLIDTTLVLEADDLFIFGELGKEVIDVKVALITPSDDYTATIMCIPAALDILDCMTGTIPAFDPVMTHPIDIERLSPPHARIDKVQSDESVLLRDVDGSLRIRMLVETSVEAFLGWHQNTQLRYRPKIGAGIWTLENPTTSNTHSLLDVDQQVLYEIQVRSVKGTLAGVWSPIVEHLVIGNSTPPPTPGTFTVTAVGDRLVMEWDSVIIPDLEQYEIRVGTLWSTATLLVRTKSTKYLSETPMTGPWLIKAIDTGGLYSTEPAEVSVIIETPVVTDITAGVVTNYVSLNWVTVAGTYATREYLIMRDGVEMGRVVGSYSTIFENEEGDYTYTVVPIDIAGNMGGGKSITVHVFAPGTDDGIDGLYVIEHDGQLFRFDTNLVSNKGLAPSDYDGAYLVSLDEQRHDRVVALSDGMTWLPIQNKTWEELT